MERGVRTERVLRVLMPFLGLADIMPQAKEHQQSPKAGGMKGIAQVVARARRAHARSP